mmetsp:Transcript_26754/g.100605  ORF Transcript_26754/g.100605 Transcript_26754/m.100605 type:complete len:304 (+) Transcript_26754:823-1734(+)
MAAGLLRPADSPALTGLEVKGAARTPGASASGGATAPSSSARLAAASAPALGAEAAAAVARSPPACRAGDAASSSALPAASVAPLAGSAGAEVDAAASGGSGSTPWRGCASPSASTAAARAYACPIAPPWLRPRALEGGNPPTAWAPAVPGRTGGDTRGPRWAPGAAGGAAGCCLGAPCPGAVPAPAGSPVGDTVGGEVAIVPEAGERSVSRGLPGAARSMVEAVDDDLAGVALEEAGPTTSTGADRADDAGMGRGRLAAAPEAGEGWRALALASAREAAGAIALMTRAAAGRCWGASGEEAQ